MALRISRSGHVRGRPRLVPLWGNHFPLSLIDVRWVSFSLLFSPYNKLTRHFQNTLFRKKMCVVTLI